jgi:hypothetical protein
MNSPFLSALGNMARDRVTPTPIAGTNGAVRLEWLGTADRSTLLRRLDMKEEVIWVESPMKDKGRAGNAG